MQIADAHNDFLMNIHNKKDLKNYVNLLKNNNVTKVFSAYYFDETKKYETQEEVFNEIQSSFNLISNEDIFTPSFEDIGFINDLNDLERVIKFKPFCVSLTWNFDNYLAGGALGEQGVTDFGKEVIQVLEASKIIVDTAHLNKKSFLEFSKITKYPIFCSHTSCRSVYDIPRALDDEQLKLISETHGYIGMCFYSKLLSQGKATKDVLLKHIDYIANLIGFDCLGLGTDFNSTGWQNILDFDLDYKGVSHFLPYLSSIYGENNIEKFAYKNLLNFYNMF